LTAFQCRGPAPLPAPVRERLLCLLCSSRPSLSLTLASKAHITHLRLDRRYTVGYLSIVSCSCPSVTEASSPFRPPHRECPLMVLPDRDRALCLPKFSHLLIVNKLPRVDRGLKSLFVCEKDQGVGPRSPRRARGCLGKKSFLFSELEGGGGRGGEEGRFIQRKVYSKLTQ
jgi:hypothetical protein